MTDFRAAFKAGLDAAAKAEIARNEIDEVFTELGRQIAEETNGDIDIERREFEERVSNPFVTSLADIFGKTNAFWAVAARNPKAQESKWRQLAKWKQAQTGYPCTVSWAPVERVCHDRASLETALAALLQDPVVAEKLNNLRQLPPPQPALAGPGNT